MKLWLLEQDENCEYDTFDSLVVSAETYEEARAMMPTFNGASDDYAPGENQREYVWAPVDKVTCTLIGEAIPGAVKCVWCASFNAG